MARPKLEAYLKTHLKSIASFDASEERHWNLYCSIKRAKPSPIGDEDYPDKRTRPAWKMPNPLWLIPASEAASRSAKRFFENQAGIVDLPFAKLAFHSGDRFEPAAPTLKTVHLSAASIRLQLGRWFRLQIDEEQELYVWISTDSKYQTPLVSFDASARSFVNGPQPICNLRPAFRLENSGAADWRDFPDFCFEAAGHPNRATNFAAVKWRQAAWGGQFTFKLTARSELLGANAEHRSGLIERAGEPDVLDVAHGRRLLLRAVSPLGQTLLLTGDCPVFCEQVTSLDPGNSRSAIRVFLAMSPKRVADLWNSKVGAKVPDALRHVRRGSNTSVAPQLSEFKPQATGTELKGWFQSYDVIESNGPELNGGASFSLTHSGFSDGVYGDPAEISASANARWEALRDEAGAGLERKAVVLSRRKSADDLPDDGTLFEFFLEPFTVNANIRDGALDLQFGGKIPDPGPRHFGRLRTLLHSRNDSRPIFFFQWNETALNLEPIDLSYSVEELVFLLLGVTPGAQDRRPEDEFLPAAASGSVVQGAGERSQPPLIIPLSNPPPAAEASELPQGGSNVSAPRYLLIANESTNVAQSLRLDFRIEALPNQTGASQAATVVVLDSAPQMVAQVRSGFLQLAERDTGTNIVARRSPLSEEREGWEFFNEKALTEGFELRLPSQVLGEEAVKGFEFPEKDHVADSRFGPPAILRVAPERLDRGFVAVPWNLRRILMDRGTASPGVPLLEANYELLYGLAAHLKLPGLLIAELGAKIGELPTPALARKEWHMTRGQADEFKRTWGQFLRAYRAWLNRLGVLEVSHESDPLRPAKLKEGVDYRARVALLTKQNDQTVRSRVGAHLRLPVFRDNSGEELSEEITLLHDKDHGLAGGFHWGFESKEIYREFWRYYEQSSSGEVADLAFSSLGGYGRQTARFAHNKTAIQSVTAQGRTHIYAVERIGRVGVFWNKAKHVILYERSAVASKQFFEQQHPHPGRPLLRKVREFVQILEPERRYPDFADQDASAPGSVRACMFKSRILPVNSSWGRTVFRLRKADGSVLPAPQAIGWEIPLWQEGLNPEVYPKPQIALHLAPPTDSGIEAVPVNLDEPQVLRFYTDIREKDDEGNILTDDVHAWPVIEEVDYPNQPDPRVPDIAPSASQDPSGIDAPLPGALFIPPGFERCTFRVVPSELPADVAGSYFQDAGINGKLRTATMMRSEPKEDATAAQKWWKPAGSPGALAARMALEAMVKSGDGKTPVLAQSANGFTETIARLRSNGAAAAGAPSLDSFRQKAAGWIDGAVPGVKELAKAGFVDPKLSPAHPFYPLWNEFVLKTTNNYSLLTRPGRAIWREVLEGADAVRLRTLSYYNDLTGAFKKEIEALEAKAEGAATEASNAIERLIQRLEGFDLRLEWQLAEAMELALRQSAGWRKRSSGKLRGWFQTEIIDQLEKIAHDSANVGQAQTKLKAAVTQADKEAVAALKKVVDELRALLPASAARLDALQKAVEAELKKLRDLLNEEIDKTAADVQVLIDRIRAKTSEGADALALKADELLQPFDAELKTALQDAKKFLGDFHADVRAMLGAAVDALRTLHEILKASGNNVFTLRQKIDSVIADGRTKLERALLAGIQAALVGEKWNPGQAPVAPCVYPCVRLLDRFFNEIGKFFESLLPGLALGDVDAALKELFGVLDSARELEKAITAGNPKAIIDAAEKLSEELNAEFGKMAGELAGIARQALLISGTADEAVQEAKNVLRNARSVWNEFTAPGLGFNRRTIEMVVKFNPKNLEERLGLTPSIARVKELGDQLEGLGLRFPAVGLANRLLPAFEGRFAELKQSLIDKFDFSNVLSDIGGMRLTKLLPGLKMPQAAQDKIKITQGFDKEKLKAWVNAETDIKLDQRQTLMSLGPLLVSLSNGRFTGQTRIETDVEGRVQKVARGALSGDWTIALGGTEFMTYEAVVIRFEGGKLDFDLDPKRMKSPGLLKLMTDVSQTIPLENGSFKFGLVNSGGFPVGVRADLEIGPFGGSGGVSGISNLLFGGFFELRVFEPPNKFEFEVATGFHVGRQETPFDLQVFILGGGGYMDVSFRYKPLRNELQVDAALSVHASASLRVDVGWLRGGVAIYLGLEAEYHKAFGKNPAFYASLFIMVEGYVSIISLITIHLMLRLTCTFKSLPGGGTELVGTGMVSVTIRITRFFKITVRKNYTRVIAHTADKGHTEAVADHVANMLDEAAAGRGPVFAALGHDAFADRAAALGEHHAAMHAAIAAAEPELPDYFARCDAHITMLEAL